MGLHGHCGQIIHEESLGLRKGLEVGKVSGDTDAPCYILAKMSQGPCGKVVCPVEGNTKSAYQDINTIAKVL